MNQSNGLNCPAFFAMLLQLIEFDGHSFTLTAQSQYNSEVYRGAHGWFSDCMVCTVYGCKTQITTSHHCAWQFLWGIFTKILFSKCVDVHYSQTSALWSFLSKGNCSRSLSFLPEKLYLCFSKCAVVNFNFQHIASCILVW